MDEKLNLACAILALTSKMRETQSDNLYWREDFLNAEDLALKIINKEEYYEV